MFASKCLIVYQYLQLGIYDKHVMFREHFKKNSSILRPLSCILQFCMLIRNCSRFVFTAVIKTHSVRKSWLKWTEMTRKASNSQMFQPLDLEAVDMNNHHLCNK